MPTSRRHHVSHPDLGEAEVRARKSTETYRPAERDKVLYERLSAVATGLDPLQHEEFAELVARLCKCELADAAVVERWLKDGGWR